MRSIGLQEKKKADLLFFHDDQTVNEDIACEYNCIEVEATSMGLPRFNNEEVNMFIQIIPLSSPKPLPEVSEIVYLRHESGVQFQEINTFFVSCEPSGITTSIRVKVNEALRGKVTPDLRHIQFRWTKSEKEALITFIHNAPVTPEVEAHYKEIFEIATAVPWRHDEGVVTPHMEVVPIPYPQPLPNKGPKKNFYTRREPFEDPKDEYE